MAKLEKEIDIEFDYDDSLIPEDWRAGTIITNVQRNEAVNNNFIYLSNEFLSYYKYSPKSMCFFIQNGEIWLQEERPLGEKTEFISRTRANSFSIMVKVTSHYGRNGELLYKRLTIPTQLRKKTKRFNAGDKVVLERHFDIKKVQDENYIRWRFRF